jgi:hypothetical protein
MFITKKHIARRTFLHGMGVSVALPLLEAMLPAQTLLKNTAANSTQRFHFAYIPHGMIMDEFTPKTEGGNFEITNILSPLEPFRDQLHVVSGLEAALASDNVGGDHARSAATFLSGASPERNLVQNAHLATTVDQVIAQKIGQETSLPSLELGIEDTSYSGACDDGYSCAYMNTISWAAPRKPLPMQRNPLVVFERLFGDGSTPEQRLARQKQHRSILDSVKHDVARLGRMIGPSDRTRLGEYLDEIREIERRLQAVSKATAESPMAEAPVGVPQSWDAHVKLMYDLQTLAYRADITRVSTLMYSRDKINRSFPESGVFDPFHSASHHSGASAAKKVFAQINRYHLQTFAYFLQKLKSTPDGDGNLLDHSLIMVGSTMSNGDIHDHSPLPVVVAGGAAGQLKGGRHVRYPVHTPLANLLLTVLHTVGIPRESFGDSTGTLEI